MSNTELVIELSAMIWDQRRNFNEIYAEREELLEQVGVLTVQNEKLTTELQDTRQMNGF